MADISPLQVSDAAAEGRPRDLLNATTEQKLTRLDTLLWLSL